MSLAMLFFSGGKAREGRAGENTVPRCDRLETIVLIGLAAMILLAPWPYGSVAPWSQGVLFGMVALLVAIWLVGAAARGELVWVRSRVWLLGAALFLWLGLALVPLPRAWVAAFSPEAARAHQSALGNGEHLSQATLSIFPHGTEVALFRLLCLAGVFFLIVQTFRRKRPLVAVAVVIVVAAGLELAYGGYRLVTGTTCIFWNRPVLASRALAGSFLDSGQLASLLVVGLSITMGFWMATGGARSTSADGRGPVWRRRRMLLVIGVLLGLGICFTRSHAGLLSTLAAVFFFLLCVGLAARLRPRTLVLFAMVALVLSAGQFIALEMMITWIEADSPSVMPGWLDRLDLYRSACSLVSAFFWTGSGIGTFDAVFPRFQSSRFGDQVAEQLENDWFQFAGEAGIPGVLLAIGPLAVVMLPTLRKGIRRKDPFCRWLTLGALTGAVGVLVQSGLDGVIVRFSSHGIALAALLGTAYAAARVPGVDTAGTSVFRTRRINLGGFPLRAGVALGGLVVLVALAWRPLSRAAADVAYNRQLVHQGQATDRRFFLPLAGASDLEEAARCNARARQLDPGNPRYRHGQARLFLDRVARESHDRARNVARMHLGSLATGTQAGEPAGLEDAELDRLAEALYPGVRQEALGEHRAGILQALAAMDTAVRQRPTCATFRLDRSALLLDLLACSSPGDPGVARWRERIGGDASLAMALAPNKPRVLYRAGTLMVELASVSPVVPGSSVHWALASRGLRRALAVEPDYSGSVYDLVMNTDGRHRSLFSVTPRTAGGYTRLAERLIAEEAWAESLDALDILDRMASRGRADASAVQRARIYAACRRATIHGRLGQWARRAEAVQALKVQVEAAWMPDVDAARQLAVQERFVEAALRYRKVVEHDPGHPVALLELARLLSGPGANEARAMAPPALRLLHRLIRIRREVAPEILASAASLAGTIQVQGPEEETVRAFVRGVAFLRQSRLPEARQALRIARRDFDDGKPGGLSGHEIEFQLGRVAEAGGDDAAARAAYATVLARVPTHLGAWQGKNRLQGGGSTWPPLDIPDDLVRTDVVFGERARLVGYGFGRPDSRHAPDNLCLITVWECGWRSLEGLSLRVVLTGADPEDQGPRSTWLGGRDVRSGALIVRSVLVPAAGWREIRLAVAIDRPDVGEEACLQTDACEPDLRLAAPSIE